MNEGPISAGKVVAVGRLGAGADGVDVPGASKDIAAIASWSSIVSDGKRRDISLHHHRLATAENMARSKTNLLYFSPLPLVISNSRTGFPMRISSRRCSILPLRPDI